MRGVLQLHFDDGLVVAHKDNDAEAIVVEASSILLYLVANYCNSTL